MTKSFTLINCDENLRQFIVGDETFDLVLNTPCSLTRDGRNETLCLFWALCHLDKPVKIGANLCKYLINPDYTHDDELPCEWQWAVIDVIKKLIPVWESVETLNTL